MLLNLDPDANKFQVTISKDDYSPVQCSKLSCDFNDNETALVSKFRHNLQNIPEDIQSVNGFGRTWYFICS
jgi:hypothetical protein